MGIYDKGQLRGAYSVGYEAGVKAGADAMRDLRDQCGALREAITLTLEENAHLADGDVCTLSRLKAGCNLTPELSRAERRRLDDGLAGTTEDKQ